MVSIIACSSKDADIFDRLLILDVKAAKFYLSNLSAQYSLFSFQELSYHFICTVKCVYAFSY